MQDIYKVETHPLALSENMITGDKYRITFLTEGLIRLEYDEEGVFEDRPTQMVFFRDFPKTDYRVVRTEDGIEVHTKRIHLIYNEKEFTSWGLSIQVKGNLSAYHSIWHYGEEIHDLKGTARTLDMVNGATELEHGILSRFGYSLADDSRSQVLLPDGWIEPRRKGIIDIYFFGYGHDYLACLDAFYHLCGKTPMVPRYALGNWWSRYYRYTQDEYLQLMDRFKREGIPFTTSVIDMDWHRVDDVDPKYGSGWTGYSWDKQLFPDHEAFLRDLHERGLKATLNVHPRDGVRAFEDDYEAVAKRVGIDPATEEAVEFDLTNPDFVSAYFDMHHRMEAEGVDFWWLDWQQGGVTRQPGLDPLWVLNHLHYLDSGRYETSSERNVNENCECEKCAEPGARDEHEMHVEQSERNVSCTERNNRWPLTFSRYAGPGSHRYPVGFSGDTIAVPAVFHCYRVEYRLRMVESRYWRSYVWLS